MSAAALALVLTAAGIHATWNLLAKRVGGGAPFLWLFDVLSLAIYAPLALVILLRDRQWLGGAAVLFIVGTGFLHVAYFVLLQRGYRAGDLSLVYPLARGTGPVLATAGAIALFGERPTPLALAGAALVAIGAFVIAGRPGGSGGDQGRAIQYGLLTGGSIALYTIWDKHAVTTLLVPPLLLHWGGTVVRAAVITPLAVRRWDTVRDHWRRHRREAIAVAALGPLSYILVLTALVTAPVSYVAPAREISILFGAALGSRLLAEGQARRRLAGAGGMVTGIALLAIA